MRNQLICLLLLGACTDPVDPSTHIKLPPNGGIIVPAARTVKVPPGAFGFAPGTLYMGQTIPGNANVVAAPVSDENNPNPSVGTGDYNVTLGTTAYSGALMSEAISTTDPDDNEVYLVFGGYRLYTVAGNDALDQIVAIVKLTDFAVGATVALDGNDRFAMFGTGSPYADEPTTVGAASSGTITFTSGSTNIGGTITASLQGDFGPASSSPPDQGDGVITAGTYALSVTGPSQVYCEGSLTGHEADYAAIALGDLGFGTGAVALATPSTTTVIASGAPISAAYGSSSVELDQVAPELFAAVIYQAGPGPASTTLVGKYLAVDASSATSSLVYASVGAGYETSDASGDCTVAFAATLTQ